MADSPHDLLPRNSRPDRDLPPAPVQRQYVIASMPRSGSSLLADHLHRRGFGYPLEYLNIAYRPHWARRAGTADYLPYVKAHRTSLNGTFGMKVHYDDVGALLELEERSALLTTRFVLLTRRDVLSQATSFWRAQQTQAWTSWDDEQATARFDWQQINQSLEQVVRGDAGWRGFTAALGLVTLEVTYEQLVHDPEDVLRRIAAFLEVELPPADVLKTPHRQKQSTALQERWESPFVDETRSRLLAGSYPARPPGPRPTSRLRRLHLALGRPVPDRWTALARAHDPRRRC